MTDTAMSLEQEWYGPKAEASVADVLVYLDRVEERLRHEEPGARTAQLLVAVFARLQDLTAGDPDTATGPLLDRLLPYCLDDGPPGVVVESHYGSILLDRLSEWVGQYPAEGRARLRRHMLRRVKDRLRNSDTDSRGACWTAATLGYRSGGIVGALWAVVEREWGDAGDAALSALTSLGIPPGQRPRLLRALHRRAADRPLSPALLNALRRLADPASVEVVREHWLGAPARAEAPDQEFLALHVLADIADAAPDDAERQDLVWRAITEAHAAAPDGVGWGLHMGSVAARCNSARMIPDLLSLLIGDDDRSGGATHRRWLLGLRLGESLRPGQLAGWDLAAAPPALRAYRRDAAIDTRSEGYFQTAETLHKEGAWDTLLLWGRAADPGFFAKAVLSGETNPYIKARISQQLACFRLTPLPGAILALVREERDERRADRSGDMVARMAATRVVAAAGTREAFDALRHFGLTYDGMVLQDSVDALVEVAGVLASSGDTTVVDALVRDAVAAEKWRHKRAAAGALLPLAAAGLLHPEHAADLGKAILDEDRDDFERGRLVEALGYLPQDVWPAGISRRLPGWAVRDDGLGGSALWLLADSGQLAGRSQILTERLGLRRVGSTWDRDPQGPPLENAAEAIGFLYRDAPESFMPALVSILGSDDWIAALQVLDSLARVHAHGGRALPGPLMEALLDRIKAGTGLGYSETELFEAAALLAPTALQHEPWSTAWHDWRPEMRAALADALGSISLGEQIDAPAVTLLLSLTQDGQYGVRRAAYRALARQSPTSLKAISSAWTVSRDVALRERAAEAFGWLPPEDGERTGGGSPQLACDREPTVRQAEERARHERRERAWAGHALAEVLNVARHPEENPTRGWRYGQAVIRWGDDATLRTVREELGKPLAPHLRHWFRRIEHDLEERWSKAVGAWPDPWLFWDGVLEEAAGTIVFDNRVIEARFALWQKVTVPGARQITWGGTAWSLTGVPSFEGHGEVIVEIEGRGTGRAVMKHHAGDTITLVGTGPYPR